MYGGLIDTTAVLVGEASRWEADNDRDGRKRFESLAGSRSLLDYGVVFAGA